MGDYHLSKQTEIETLVRLQLFETLSQTESRYKTLVEGLHDIVFQYTGNWNIIFLNPAWQATLGYSLDDCINENFLNFIYPEDRSSLVHTLKSTSPINNIEIRLSHRHGQPIWFTLSTSLDINGGAGLLHNIDDHKRLNEHLENEVIKRTHELIQANNTKDQFFSIIAHDLRGPIGNLATMLGHKAKQGSHLESNRVKILSETAQNIYQLLDNLLTWARAQKGELNIECSHFDLTDTVKETLSVLKSSADTKGVTLSFNVAAATDAFADQAMTATVIRNLVNNAIKYTQSGDTIRVDIQKDKANYQVSIIDTGKGIADNLLEGLFTPGKTHRSTNGTSGEKGTGLGLLLCKEFVDANGGTIDAKSTIGEGSCFSFTIPRTQSIGSET